MITGTIYDAVNVPSSTIVLTRTYCFTVADYDFGGGAIKQSRILLSNLYGVYQICYQLAETNNPLRFTLMIIS